MAHITVNYRLIYLGLFRTQKAAAKRYNEGARQYFGTFAFLNRV